MKTLFRNARILKMDGSDIFFANLLVEDERIKYIGNNVDEFAPFDKEIDCNGNLLMPGFKNAHGHAGMSFLRSKADDTSLQDWLFNVVFPREELFTPDDIYHLSKISFLEYLTSGITASFEQYFYPRQMVKAAEEIGMRLLILATYTSYCDTENLIADCNYFNNRESSLIKYIVGIHAEYTSNQDDIINNLKALNAIKSPFFTHLCETQKEVDECKERHNDLSPVEYFTSLGFFNYGGGGYHCIYMSKNDLEIFKKHNLTVVSCPGSNCKLASGIAPITLYLKENINVAIGTDGPASNNSLDMFKEMTLLTDLAKVTNKDPICIKAYDVLKMATVNGAKAMNLFDSDILEVGKFADMIMIDLMRPNMQPINNIINNLVYSGSKDVVKMTMINGKILYLDGKFYLDESIDYIYKKCQEVTDKLDKMAIEK